MARPGPGRAARAARGTFAGGRGARAGGSARLTPRRAAVAAGGALLLVYLITMAPGVTFWDAGEFIAAAHVFGIPHPPGTPLFVALGRAWTLLLSGAIGVARASNMLSAVSSAVAGALAAWLVSRETVRGEVGAIAGALCAGFMLTAWSNATETEVYAISLLHVMLMLACGARAGAGERGADGNRWTLCLAYLIALAPAVHLSALVGAPAAIALAARDHNGKWNVERAVMLLGVLVIAAGIGRMSWVVAGAGAVIMIAGAVRVPSDRRMIPATLALAAIAASALLILLVRARFDPAINQGNPSTLAAMADVVARRQYDVAPMWPRRAPPWIQVATLMQYVDWQYAWTWGRGIFTSPLRGAATFAFVCLGGLGWGALRRDARRLADALTVLLVCGSIGVVAYLNLRAGASIGYGFVPADAHEARERDYFFVLAFWAWGILAGYGAASALRSRGWPLWLAFAAPMVPLVANWTASDRARSEGGFAPRAVALALLTSAPKNAVLFVAGDNDTYPLWYLQQVEGVRTDVTPVTLPLLPADWYGAEIARRTRLHWSADAPVPGARWQHEELAGRIAQAALASGRPVAASPSLSRAERALVGSGWTMHGSVYVARAAADGSAELPLPVASAWAGPVVARSRRARLPDDVSAQMLRMLECGRLATLPAGSSALRDSLEVSCNLR